MASLITTTPQTTIKDPDVPQNANATTNKTTNKTTATTKQEIKDILAKAKKDKMHFKVWSSNLGSSSIKFKRATVDNKYATPLATEDWIDECIGDVYWIAKKRWKKRKKRESKQGLRQMAKNYANKLRVQLKLMSHTKIVSKIGDLVERDYYKFQQNQIESGGYYLKAPTKDVEKQLHDWLEERPTTEEFICRMISVDALDKWITIPFFSMSLQKQRDIDFLQMYVFKIKMDYCLENIDRMDNVDDDSWGAEDGEYCDGDDANDF